MRAKYFINLASEILSPLIFGSMSAFFFYQSAYFIEQVRLLDATATILKAAFFMIVAVVLPTRNQRIVKELLARETIRSKVFWGMMTALIVAQLIILSLTGNSNA